MKFQASSIDFNAAPQKVSASVSGHLKVSSWGSTACPGSASSRSRTPSPPVVKDRSLSNFDEKPTATAPAGGAIATSPTAAVRPPPGLELPYSGALAWLEETPRAAAKLAATVDEALLICGECDTASTVPPSVSIDGEDEGVLLSAGSVGHPYTCAEACRYVKRKGGCRDAKNCTSCHLCFWTRTAEKDAERGDAATEEAVVSLGTRGHPFSCGEACKYARRKGGCRDGANCQSCHACLWQRTRGADSPGAATETSPNKADETPSYSTQSPASLVAATSSAPVMPAGFAAAAPASAKKVAPASAPASGEAKLFGDSSARLEDLIMQLILTPGQ